jgi:transposase-like protein
MTKTPNMRELSEFADRYLRAKPQSTIDEIARAFGIDPQDLKASWRAVIASRFDDVGRRN